MIPLSEYQLKLTNINKSIVFDCGHKDLNDFFCNEAVAYQKELLANTYQYIKDNKVIAMFSVSNDNISLSNSTKKKAFSPTKYLRYYPAVKIGRLGVSIGLHGQHIGSQIIDFLKIFFLVRNKTGCRYITVDAYNDNKTINFYKSNGSDLYTQKDRNKKTRTMFCDLLPYYKAMNSNLMNSIEVVIRKVLDSSP